MTNVFAVIGEHQDHPDRLLVLGDDGRHYAYELSTNATTPTEPTDEWQVDPDLPDPETLLGNPLPPGKSTSA